MKIRNVLSLFDGISCGQLALKKVGIEYDKYYASEIEKQPIWITQYNFPDTIQLGDVEKWRDWDIEWDKIDLLIGGSPCTNLSIAGNREGLKGEQSRLFYAYVDILNHLKKFNPNIKFLLENVESMTDSDKGIINSYMGCKPIMINSSLVSAQNRKRYYWFNWSLKKESLFGIPTCSIPQPEDKKIVLNDVLQGETDGFAGRIVGRRLNEEGKRVDYSNEDIVQKLEINDDSRKTNCLTTVQKDNVVAEPIEPSCLRFERTEEGKKLRKDYESGKIHHGFNEHRMLTPRTDNKTNTLTTVGKDNLVCESINNFVKNKYKEFAEENGYIPEMFNPYNKSEITEKSPTLSTMCGSTTTSSSVLMFNKIDKSDIGVNYFRDYGSKGKILTNSDEKTQTLTAAMGCGGGNVPAIAKSVRLGHLDGLGNGQANRIYSVKGKSVCLNANGGGGGAKTGLYKINLPDGDYIIRKLTPIECERLQTIKDDYTKFGFDGNKNVQIATGARYKALGNGWTVDVIAHIFEFLVKEGI